MNVRSWSKAATVTIDRFRAQIRSVKVRKPSLPLRRLVLEAVLLAGFVEKHWEARRAGRAPLPGLRSAAGAAGLEREVARELRDLAFAVQSLDAELKATKPRVAPAPLADARRVLGELRAPLRFLLGARAATRRALDKVQRTGRARSAHALALALEAHAALADAHAADLARLDDFVADLPERARRLALSLRAPRRDVAAERARRAKLGERDALVTLLMDRMRAVRAAARFAFREHPQIVTSATSDYERKRKQKRRRKLAP
jgi:hypothetical protein